MLRQLLKIVALTISVLLAGFSGQLALADDDEGTCDPLEVERVIELAHYDQVEVTRPSSGPFKFHIDINPDMDLVEAEYKENDRVIASAVEVILEGESCSGLVEQVKVYQGEDSGWLPLRVAGKATFLPRYFRNTFPIESLDIGIKLILFQRAFCDITVNSVIYREVHPFLRQYPSPDPQC